MLPDRYTDEIANCKSVYLIGEYFLWQEIGIWLYKNLLRCEWWKNNIPRMKSRSSWCLLRYSQERADWRVKRIAYMDVSYQKNRKSIPSVTTSITMIEVLFNYQIRYGLFFENGIKKWQYAYDEQGRRIEKAGPRGMILFDYAGDSNQLMTETDTTDKLIREYVYNANHIFVGLKINGSTIWWPAIMIQNMQYSCPSIQMEIFLFLCFLVTVHYGHRAYKIVVYYSKVQGKHRNLSRKGVLSVLRRVRLLHFLLHEIIIALFCNAQISFLRKSSVRCRMASFYPWLNLQALIRYNSLSVELTNTDIG